jgi:hypothetical protein
MNNEEEILKKAIKLYITGKEEYNRNKNIARKLFESSLDTLKLLKNSNNFSQLIQTTEAECIKYINTSSNIFELIKINDIESIKNIEHINFRDIDENGNTVLHCAIDIGDTGILKELFKKGGMIDTVNGNGNTLLEYACLKKDPNIISFIIMHGGNMKKHLFFRKGDIKYYLNKSDIDMAILLKLIIVNSINKTEYTNFIFLEKYFNINELIGLDKYTFKDLMIGLNFMFNGKDSYKDYKNILIEELNTFEQQKNLTKCIYNKLDIVLSSLVPFINYPFNMASIFLLKNEIKYLIKYILNINKNDFKNLLMNKLFDTYIQTNLYPEDYIGIIIYNLLSQINIQ